MSNTYHDSKGTVPFATAEEAWFWFIDAQQARNDGVRMVAGAGLYPRPCEPVDILKILDRLYRSRRLIRDHLLVLRHYGQRKMPPDAYRAKEARAHVLWREAMEIISDVLIQKGILESQADVPSALWHQYATVWENRQEANHGRI
jgi:hypothetical protein